MTLRIFDEDSLPVLAIAMPIRPIRTHSDHGRSIWVIHGLSWSIIIIMIIIMITIMIIIMIIITMVIIIMIIIIMLVMIIIMIIIIMFLGKACTVSAGLQHCERFDGFNPRKRPYSLRSAPRPHAAAWYTLLLQPRHHHSHPSTFFGGCINSIAYASSTRVAQLRSAAS